jgi:hypothetical protein
MLAFLRLLLFEWILARIGLRWLIGLLIAVPVALVFFIGIPTLLVIGVVGFLLWRALRRPAPPTAPPAPGASGGA